MTNAVLFPLAFLACSVALVSAKGSGAVVDKEGDEDDVPVIDMAELAGQALIDAAEQGEVRLLPRLMKVGANVNARNEDGTTPLMAAAGSGHIEILKFLLKRGAKVSMKDKKGRTALDYAKNKEVGRILWNAGCRRGKKKC